MAVQLIDGFDLYNGVGANTGLQAKWTTSSGGTGSLSMITGRFGGQAVAITAGTGSTSLAYMQRLLGSAAASVSVGFGFRITTSPLVTQTHYFLTLLDSAVGYNVGIKINADGSLSADRATGANAGTNLGSTAAGVIIANTWHYLEVSVTISATVGVVTIKVDGATVLNLSSQNTKNATNANVQTVRFGHFTGSGASAITYNPDDLYVVDSVTSLGERRVETIRPNADTAQKDFTPNTGATNYTQVNEAQVDGDTSYVQASVVGNTDRYDFVDLTGSPATIDAVQVSCFGEKTDATARSIALQVKSGATTSDGSNFALNASYGKFERLLTTDPNGGGAWTSSSVNALQAGPKVTV